MNNFIFYFKTFKKLFADLAKYFNNALQLSLP